MTRYWFRPRSHGYGATPATWAGWAVTIAVGAVVVGSILAMQLLVGRSNFVAWMIWAAIVVVVTFWFVRLSRHRTDGEWRWRWGKDTGGRVG
jgi:hypothetical protein